MQPNRPGALVALTVLVALVVCAALLPVQRRLARPEDNAPTPARQAEGSGQAQWAARMGHRVAQGFAKCKRALTMALRVLRSHFQRVLRTLQARPGHARRLAPTPQPTGTAPLPLAPTPRPGATTPLATAAAPPLAAGAGSPRPMFGR